MVVAKQLHLHDVVTKHTPTSKHLAEVVVDKPDDHKQALHQILMVLHTLSLCGVWVGM